MLSDAELEGMRAAAAELLADTATVSRDVEPGPFDPDTGAHDPPGGPTEIATNVPVRVQPQSVRERRVVVADEVQTRRVYHASCPLDEDVRVGDTLTVTSSSDGWLEGRELVVRDVVGSALATIRRLVVEDVTHDSEEEG